MLDLLDLLEMLDAGIMEHKGDPYWVVVYEPVTVRGVLAKLVPSVTERRRFQRLAATFVRITAVFYRTQMIQKHCLTNLTNLTSLTSEKKRQGFFPIYNSTTILILIIYYIWCPIFSQKLVLELLDLLDRCRTPAA